MAYAPELVMSRNDPEYMDSFYHTLPLVSGRRSHRGRAQPQPHKSFHKAVNLSGERNALQSLDYNTGYHAHPSGNLQTGTFSEERCPSCQESLHCVHSSAIAVNGGTRQDLNWFVTQQRVYLPHYCTFVDTKTLHERGDGNSKDRGQTEKDRFSQRRVLLAIPRQKGHAKRYKTLPGLPPSGASATDQGEATGEHNQQPSTSSSCVNASQSELRSRALSEGGLSAILLGAAITDVTSGQWTDLAERDSKSASYKDTPPHDKQNELSGDGNNVSGVCVQTTGCQQETGDDERTQASRTHEESLQIPPEANQISATARSPETTMACIPDLPNINTPVLASPRRGSKPTRKQFKIPQQPEKQLKLQRTNEEEFSFYQFGDLSSATERANDAITQSQEDQRLPRMIVSVKAVRFELPVDMKSLESLSPQEYVKNHCRMFSLNEKLCLRIFSKHKGTNSIIQGKSKLLDALNELLFSSISEEQSRILCELLEIDDSTVISSKLFVGITGVAERLSFDQVCFKDDSESKFQKDSIESADFYSLDWKLRNIGVRKDMRVLLHLLL